jgi:hypothetical protein
MTLLQRPDRTWLRGKRKTLWPAIVLLLVSGCIGNNPGPPCNERRDDLVAAIADHPEDEFRSARWAINVYATQDDGRLALLTNVRGIADFEGKKFRSDGVVYADGTTKQLDTTWVVGETAYHRIHEAWHPPYHRAPAERGGFVPYFLPAPLIGDEERRGEGIVRPSYSGDSAVRRRIADALITRIQPAEDATIHAVRTRHCTVTLHGRRAEQRLPRKLYREMVRFGEAFRDPTDVDIWIDGKDRLIRLATSSRFFDRDKVIRVEREFWDYDSAPPVKLPENLFDPAPTTTPGGRGITSLAATLRTSQGRQTEIRVDDGDPQIEFEGLGGEMGEVELKVITNPGIESSRILQIFLTPAAGSSIRRGTYIHLDPDHSYRQPDKDSGANPSFWFHSKEMDCESGTESGHLELTEAVLDERGSPVRLRATFSLSCNPRFFGAKPGPSPERRTLEGEVRYHSVS